MKKLTFADTVAIRVASTFATWKFLGFQLLMITIWYLVDPLHDPTRAELDLAVSIWTLVLDCIILVGSRQQSKELLRNTEATIKVAEKAADLLDEEHDVHKKILDTQQEILKKLNG